MNAANPFKSLSLCMLLCKADAKRQWVSNIVIDWDFCFGSGRFREVFVCG